MPRKKPRPAELQANVEAEARKTFLWDAYRISQGGAEPPPSLLAPTKGWRGEWFLDQVHERQDRLKARGKRASIAAALLQLSKDFPDLRFSKIGKPLGKMSPKQLEDAYRRTKESQTK